VTEPGLYHHADVLYRVVQIQDGRRLYAKVYDSAAGEFVYCADGLKVADLRADEFVTPEQAAALAVG
jgi:hypothetical protein